MPAHALELNDPKTLARLLLALAMENGGEVRLRASVYDSIDRGRILLVDYDRKRGQVVLKASSDFARAVTVAPESYQWVAPPAEAPMERARIRAAAMAERVSIPTDEELADREERAQRNQKLAEDVEAGKIPIRLRTMPPTKSPA